MFFESYKSILYSDTLVPDIFITEYMPSMDGDYIKVYLHCMFLSKHNKQVSTEDMAKNLLIDINKVKDALTYLESVGVISRKENSIVLVDLKEKEINKIYRIKATSTPEEAVLSSERNKKRNSIVSAINNTFFQGVMSPSWYTDIDAWFDKYKFEEDVMYALFQHCYDHHALSKNYILKVAESWHSKSIVNSFDLDKYFVDYQKLKDIKLKITKKLNLKGRFLTEYEQEYIERWVMDYKYEFEIIELALKRTTTKSDPNFEYLNTIITDWYNNNLRTKDEVTVYLKSKRQSRSKNGQNQPSAPQQANFEQRKYDDDYYDKLYENTGN